MRNRRKSPVYYANQNTRALLFLLLPVLTICILVSIFTVTITRAQNIKYISDIITLYCSDISLKLDSVKHFVSWSVLNDPVIKNFQNANSITTQNSSLRELRTRISDFQYTVGKEYQFFLHLKDKDLFLNTSDLQVDYPHFLSIKNFFTSSRTGSTVISTTYGTWKYINLIDGAYLYYAISFNNTEFICIISLDDFVGSLKNINLGKYGAITFVDTNSHVLYSTQLTDFLNNPKHNTPFSSYKEYSPSQTGLPFLIHVNIDHFTAFEKIILVQLATILLAITIVITLVIILFYMNKKVIKPIQIFSKNLSDINNNTDLLNLQSSNIIELEQANKQFKNLMHEIKKLKINLYELELEKEKIQIEFLQQQIKPHFYLNCLTTIYSMAQTKMYDEIEQMCLSTSSYFRYLFQINKDYVKLKYELKHISNYLNIQKLLYSNSFSYFFSIEDGLENAKIPPLVLQTFIENAIKHSVCLDTSITINLSITRYTNKDGDFLKIIISDTGIGFSLDILEKLQNNQLLTGENGTLIGITNTIQRLKLLYDKHYQINFYNGTCGGATIEMDLPYALYIAS
ncbi:MAG: sensor histidine kinase [Cellulosilyticaceae bacterium]